ncbi:hypothetical protein ACJJTC_001062 [Scirpophaga incertulas]
MIPAKVKYMMTYSASGGFLPTEEGSGGNLKCTSPQNDPLVVLAECTRVMLEDRTLATARMVARRLLDGLDPGHWVQSSYKWINGVPGCGKTTWIEKHFKTKHDIAVTVTVEAAKDIRSRTAAAAGKQDKNRVRIKNSPACDIFRAAGSTEAATEKKLVQRYVVAGVLRV